MIDVNDIVDAVDKNLVKSKSNKKKTKELNPLEKRKQIIEAKASTDTFK